MVNNVIVNYLGECFEELHKVTWPTKNQAIRLTAIVLIFSLVFSFFIAGVDYVFNYLVQLSLEKFS